MIVDFKVIPHKDQAYPTVGNWAWCTLPATPCPFDLDRGDYGPHVLHIRVSKLSDRRYELLVFHHELTEALLCREAGVTAEQVDAWDEEFEKRRCDDGHWKMTCHCLITSESEPGDDLHCPYGPMHATATECERKMAKALGVDWAAYNDEVEKL